MTVAVHPPLTGTIVAAADVPDPVFAGGFVGPGLAVEPDPGPDAVDAVAPLSGRVVKLHPHAFIVQAPTGAAVLVHLGIDTVQLRGEGFTTHVAEGDEVTAGQRLITWDPATVRASGRSAVCPVVALEAAPESVTLAASPGTAIGLGDLLLTIG